MSRAHLQLSFTCACSACARSASCASSTWTGDLLARAPGMLYGACMLRSVQSKARFADCFRSALPEPLERSIGMDAYGMVSFLVSAVYARSGKFCGCSAQTENKRNAVCGSREPITPSAVGAVRRLKKLMYRVVFPFELKLRNVADECADADNVFHLFAVVVHVGSGLNHGRAHSLICALRAHVHPVEQEGADASASYAPASPERHRTSSWSQLLLVTRKGGKATSVGSSMVPCMRLPLAKPTTPSCAPTLIVALTRVIALAHVTAWLHESRGIRFQR